MNSEKFLLGVIIGIATGAALGILFAPEKGSITRKQISKKGEDLLDNLKAKFEDPLLKVTNKLESVKSEAEVLLDKGKENAKKAKNEMKSKAEDLLDKGKEKAKEIKNESIEKFSTQS